jgi:hypothetical protein
MNHSPVPMLTIKKLVHALELFAQWERTGQGNTFFSQ